MTTSVLRHGDSGPGVAEIRDRLIHLGLLAAETSTDTFNDMLEDALRVFQQSRGLTVDGIAGPQTLRRLEEARWALGDRVLAYTPGHLIHGEDVAQLQQRLLELGFTLDRVDGIFGRNTDAAVREFQRNVGLGVDGICGPEVFNALNRLNRTVAGGNQEHLRELASWDVTGRPRGLEAAVIFIDPSDDARQLVGTDLTEAQVCWDIANRTEGRLLATGSQVVLTHGLNNQAADERARAGLANDHKANMVISLRCDSYQDSRAHGVATYYFGHAFSRSASGMRLAELIQEEITARSALNDCSSHAKTWDLLRLTRMPAVRIELGYITSELDSNLLADEKVRDDIAAAIASGITRSLAPRIG
jgi:N-acetylmuramoyl-L-alanine amidase